MICPNCGRLFEENEKFCANCGTPRPEEQPVQPPVEQNIVPDAQNTTVSENVQPVGYQGAENAPFSPDAVQPITFENSEADMPVKAKKSKKGIIISAVAVLVAVAVVAGIFFIPKFFKAEPEEQFKTITKNYAKNISVSAGNVIGSISKTEGFTISGSADVHMGSEVLSLLVPGEELEFLSDIALDYVFKANTTAYGFDLDLKISKKSVAEISAVLDMENSVIYISCPTVSEETLCCSMDELGIEGDIADIEEFFDTDEFEEAMAEIEKMLPDAKVVEELLYDYLCLIIDSVDSVETKDSTLKAGGVSEELTLLEVSVSEKTLADVVLAVVKKAKDDKRVTDIISDFAEYAGEDGESVVKEFKDGADEILDTLKGESLDTTPVMYINLWVDDDDNVSGISFSVAMGMDQEIKFATTKNGDKRGFEISFTQASEKVGIIGSGKVKSNKLTGTYKLSVMGGNGKSAEFIELGLKNIDLKAIDKGGFEGTISLKPGKDFIDILDDSGADLDKQIEVIIKSVELEVYAKLSDNQAKYKFDVFFKGASAFGFGMDMSVKNGKPKIEIPDEYVEDIEDWANTIDTEKILSALEKAGIPDELIEQLTEELAGGYEDDYDYGYDYDYDYEEDYDSDYECDLCGSTLGGVYDIIEVMGDEYAVCADCYESYTSAY